MKKALYLTLFITGMIIVFIGALLRISSQGNSSISDTLLVAGVLVEIAAFVVYAITRYKTV